MVGKKLKEKEIYGCIDHIVLLALQLDSLLCFTKLVCTYTYSYIYHIYMYITLANVKLINYKQKDLYLFILMIKELV